MEKYNFDTIILGGGPAGLSAGLYAARGAISTAIIDINLFGGQPSNYLELENYPGFFKINGYDLMEKMEAHSDLFGVQKFPMQEIVSVDLVSTPKKILTKSGIFEAKTIIIATGAKPTKLQITGEDEFLGKGVSYCAVCDGAFYKDKVVAVVGGGNSAIEEGLYLTNFASKVYIIHRRDELRADKIIQQRAMNNDKIEIIYESLVCEIMGDAVVNSISIRNVKTLENTVIKVDGVFPYIGISPNIEFLNGQIEQDSKGFIITDETMKTSIDGVFAVGDVRKTPLRQVVTAVSDGAVAAVYATKYLDSLTNVKVL
jgi:thioredoxin reductase (NADPH)